MTIPRFLFKEVLSLVIAASIIFPPQFAQASSNQLSCKHSFKHSEKLEQADWHKPANVFSNSLGSTITNGVLWLTAVQAIKYMAFKEQGAEFLTNAFMVTVPLDIGLTLVSHWISLGKFPALKNFTEGKTFGPKYEFWSRVAANVSISTLGITSAWAIANQFGAKIPIQLDTISAAIILCMLVYPTLQVTKPFLLDKLPNLSNSRDQKEVEKIMGPLFNKIKAKIQSKAKDENIDPLEAEKLFLQMLDLVISANNWEQKITDTSLVDNNLRIKTLLKRISSLKKQSTNENKISLVRLRQELSYEASKEIQKSKYSESLENHVFAIEGLGSRQSIELISKLGKIRRNRAIKVFGASVVDQALAVGIAGGVLLYGTTHWAETGELPIFLQK